MFDVRNGGGKVLVGPVERDLRELMGKQAACLDAEIIALDIMPEHMHLFLSCAPGPAPNPTSAFFQIDPGFMRVGGRIQ